MSLFKQYILFTLKNTMRFPKFAFKLLPGLALAVIFSIWTLYKIITTPPAQSIPEIPEIILSTPIILLVVVTLLAIYGSFGNKAIVGARAADANFLMPAPISPFQFFIFMNLKTLLSIIGVLFMIIALYTGETLAYFTVPAMSLPLYFSIMVPLYAQQFLHYISKTTTNVVGRFAKWLFVVFFIGTLATAIFISFEAHRPTINHILVHAWPLFGWVLGFMYAIAVNNIVNIFVFGALLIGTLVALYFMAKSTSYNYYEEELTYVQKTEAQFKRAYSGQTIELKSKFVKSNRQFTSFNEKTLLDRAWIKAGKLWWLHPGLIMKSLLMIAAVFFVTKVIADELPFTLNALILLGVAAYLRLFAVGIKNNELTQDLYLHLIPVKPIYKLVYPLLIPILRSAIFSAIVGGALVVLGSQWQVAESLLFALLLFSIELFDIFRCYDLQSLTINNYLGNVLRQIVEMLVLGITTAIIGLPIFFLQASAMTFGIAVLIMVLLIVLVLFLSLKAYDHAEKGAKDDISF